MLLVIFMSNMKIIDQAPLVFHADLTITASPRNDTALVSLPEDCCVESGEEFSCEARESLDIKEPRGTIYLRDLKKARLNDRI